MRLTPNQRRPEFDELTQGWGSDSAVDLAARCDLLGELFTKLGGWTDAEQKVATAMGKRLGELVAP